MVGGNPGQSVVSSTLSISPPYYDPFSPEIHKMSDEPAWKLRLRRLQALQSTTHTPDSASNPPSEAPTPPPVSQSPAALAAQARQLALDSGRATPASSDAPAAAPPTLDQAQTGAREAREAAVARQAAAAAASSSSSSSPAPAAPPEPPSVARPTPNPVAVPSPSPRSIPRPSAALATPTSAPAHPQPPAAPVKPTKSFAEWESDRVEEVLNVTVDVDKAEARGWSVTLLEDVASDLKSEGKSTSLTPPSMINELLIARLSLDPSSSMTDSLTTLSLLAALPQDQTCVQYLLGCYRRLLPLSTAASRAGYQPAEVERWKDAWKEIKDALVSYLSEVLKDPGMFPQPQPTPSRPIGPEELLPLLLTPTHQPSTLLPLSSVPLLLTDLARTGEQEFATKILSPALSVLLQRYWSPAQKEANQTLVGSGGQGWERYLGAIARVVQSKEVATVVGRMPIWLLESATAPQVEFMSLLGPFLRLGTFPREFPAIVTEFFANPTDRQRADILASQKTLQASVFSLVETCFGIFEKIVRSGAEGRETVLRFLERVIELNRRRAGSRVPRETVSSDSFMVNLQSLLLRFATPIMDVQFSKLSKVDPDFFVKSNRISMADVTRLRATQAEADEYNLARRAELDQSGAAAASVNFISEVVWLTCALHHVGLGKTIGTRGDLEKKLGDIERDLRQVEADDSWRNSGGAVRAQGEALQKKLKDQVSSIHASLHAFDAQLLDPDLVSRTMAFQTFVMTWFVRLVDPNRTYPATTISLPLPEESPINFRMLPEYILEDIADYHVFLISHSPQTFDTADLEKLITFIITFLSGKYVKNPFVKAKLVEFLSMGCTSWGPYRQGVLGPALAFHPLATEQLVPSLIAYYIDMEATGGHQQFYDKFSMRRHAISILRYLWSNPVHREAFEKDSIDNEDRFVVFANMHMNDCTFLLEESLTNLAKIYALETEMASPSFTALPEAERKDKQSDLKSAENQAGWSTDGGRRNVSVLKEWTDAVKEPFMKPEIIDRLAAMLCFNLATLVGPKMQELKVRDPKKYRFDAKSLLGDLTDIFRNLGTEQRFVEAVAREGRSYRKEVFESLARILQHRAVKTQSEIQQIVLFCDKVEETRLKIEAEEEGEDLPDEFLDPLMYTLMRDPVILPSSKTTIDRSTIKSHLLSDPTDPFNRMPLKLEECEPDVELKQKIDTYLTERRLRQVEPMHVDGIPDA